MQPMKEAATNVAASAKAGMDKTKATVQEKVEKMTAHDPMQKEMATQKKEERITQAELNKQQAREAAKQHGTGTGVGHTATGGTYGTEGYPTGAEAYGSGTHQTGYGTGTHSYSTTGTHGHQTGGHQMSALPGHGTGQPTGQVTEGTVGSHPIGTNPGTGGPRARNTHVGGGGPAYGTGGSYS